MSLLRFEDIRLEFGEQVILRDAEFSIEPGERVCLIGRNGAGKSTTFKLITGEMEADQGAVVRKTGLIVSELRQNLPDADRHRPFARSYVRARNISTLC